MNNKFKIRLRFTSLVLVLTLLMSTWAIPTIVRAETEEIAEEPPYIVGEIESMRTENKKVFRMSDGKMQAAIYNSSVHYEEDGEWKEINSSFEENNNEEYVTKSTKDEIILSKKYKKGKTVEIASEEYNISWGFVGANNSEAEIVEQEAKKLEGDEKYTTLPSVTSTTVYEDIYEDVDAEYIISGDSIKENLILNDENAQNEFEIEYRYKKLTAVQVDDKTIELQNSDEETVYTITAPVMKDEDGAISDALTLKIEKQNSNKLAVKLTADKEWLQDSDRNYPVIVDPSFSMSSSDLLLQFSQILKDDEEDVGYDSGVGIYFNYFPYLGSGTYITNMTLRLFFNNNFSGEMPIYYCGTNQNIEWSSLKYKIKNEYASDIEQVANGFYYGEWNLTKDFQQNYPFNLNISFAIAGETEDLYSDLAYNTKLDTIYLSPTLEVTYINQSGISDKFSYHQYDMESAGTVYINDLLKTPIIKRDDFSVSTSSGSVDIGMTYTTYFNYHLGSGHSCTWRPYYFESVSYYPDNSSYKYVWNTDDGNVIYFAYSSIDENGEEYYYDENGEGYSLYNTTVTDENEKTVSLYKIVTADSKVFEFSQDGRNETTKNEKYLTKIYYLGSETSALTIEYNDVLKISSITDDDGNEYIYTYDDELTDVLISVECEEQEKLVEYIYEGRNLVEVRCGKSIINYEYFVPDSVSMISSVILPNNYKLEFLISDFMSYYINGVSEYGYDLENEEWVKGNQLTITRYPFKTTYEQLDAEEKICYTENYYFDGNGYLASISNDAGYAINQNSDSEGNVFANTDITIPVVNLIKDSNFEKENPLWQIDSDASIKSKTDTINNAYFGKKWLEITNSSAKNTIAKQSVSNLSSGTYTFSAYVKTDEGKSISIGENGTIYDGISVRATTNGNTKKATGIQGEYSEWTRVYVTFDVSIDNSSVELELGLYNASGTVYFDAVQLEKHKRAYDYNTVENSDFTDNTSNDWTTSSNAVYSSTSSIGSLDNNVLKLIGDKESEIVSEQEIYLAKGQNNLSLSAWIKTEGMLPCSSSGGAESSISVIGIKDGTQTVLGKKIIDYCLDSRDVWGKMFYKIMIPISEITQDYDTYKIRIEYNYQHGYLYVDGVEVMSGVLSIDNTADESVTDTDIDSTLETEVEAEDDYEIESGYSIVSKINSFDNYTGVENCDYLTYGTTVYTTDEDGNLVKDETNSNAYLSNSWCVTENKDKYEYTDSSGNTVTTGGIWIGNKLDSSTQSGIRFWYKTTADCTVSLRSATYGKGGAKDYIVTLPAASEGTWKTLLYRDIENDVRKIADFKYIHVKTTNAPVYIDEVHTVLADSIVYSDKEYKIADVTKEENNNYPVTDEYIYNSTINNFDSYTGNTNISYLVSGTDDNAYSGNSWGVTSNKDKYTYTDSNGNTVEESGVSIPSGTFDLETQEGIRFWYKSNKQWRISLRGSKTYDKYFDAAPEGAWGTILYSDIENIEEKISKFTSIFVKNCDASYVYIDDLYTIRFADDVYDVSESYEESRDGQVMKTISSSKSLTENGKLCTINRETNSLGVDTFTTTEDETGNQISATDGNGNTINYSYDDLNNLIEMSQEVDETNLEVNYTYDNRGNISTITNGNVTYAYKYTPFGDLKSISVGDTALVTYTYISNQNRTVSKVTYANGQSINYTYTDDALTKMVSKDSAGTVTNTITYDNDETGAVLKTKDSENGTVTKTVNDITQVWNTAETKLLYSYSSDEDKLVETINGTEFKTNYSETSDSTIEETNVYETVKTTSYGNTTVTVYSDLFGRTLKEVTKSGNTIVLLKVYEYNSNGDYTTEQIKSVTTTVGTSEPETTRYTYDNNGNITGIYSKVGDNTETTVATYEYDELNQLVKENNKNYTYDNGGNILSAGNNTYSYSTGEWKDQLTSFNGESITYDEGGNPLNYMGATLTWEKGRQLKSYSKDNLNITYKYNTDGLRTEKNVNGTVYNYIWSGSKLVHQSSRQGDIHFYYDASDNIVGFEYAGDKYTYIKNIQGDILGILDESGNTVASYTYDAWGNILTSTGDLAEINPIRYRGYYYDEINMYYLQSRYYDQNVGRFINADTPSNLSSQNNQEKTILSYSLQAYCENNSIYYVDFTGNAKIKVERKVAVITIKEFSSESNYNLKALKKIYKTNNGVKKVVKSVKTFKNAWNSLDQLDCLVINTHGSSDGLYLGDGTPLVTTKNVNKLGYKKHTCVISLACDTGNYYNMWTNIAYRLECSISGVMVASDGIVSCWKDDGIKDFLYAPLNSENRKRFFGWVIYRHGGYNKYGKKGYDYWNSTNLPKGDWNGVTLAQIISYLISYNVIPKI